MTTTHEQLIEKVKLHARCYDRRISRLPAAIRRARRDGILSTAITEARQNADAINTRHLNRDYRPGVGSGRTADWLDIGFSRYAICAQAAHDTLGLTGEDCRAVARAAKRVDYPAHQAFIPAMETPESVAQMAPDSSYGNCWSAWYKLHVMPRIAEVEAKERLAMCDKNPSYRISGYLAASILYWRDGIGHSYEGCSGCESYTWHRDHPEHWDTLLAHAPQGAKGPGWEQVFAHERDRAATLQAKGWFHTLRLEDSIYTERHPICAKIG